MAFNRVKNLSWFDFISIGTKLAMGVADASRDGKITMAEVIGIVTGIVSDLGYNIQDEGFKLPGE